MLPVNYRISVMGKSDCTVFRVSLCLIISLCLGDIAVAQQGGTLEEIVVTARKREESLQETPIAVSAFSANDMEQRNLSNLMEVGNFTPNVSISATTRGAGGPSANVYIRGVGQDDFLFTTDPGVGIYIDGVYHPRTIGGVMDLLDLERVEVLRGPQGTLFGKNTIGGAINVVSAKPAEEFGGSAQISLGNQGRIHARGMVDLPIAEGSLYSKGAFSYKQRDGYGDRFDFTTGAKVDEDLGDEEQIAFRGALRWLASEDVTVDFSADYTEYDQNSLPTVLVAADPAGGVPIQLWNALIGGPAGTPFDGRYLIPDNVEDSFGTGPNKVDFEGWGVNATIEWELDWVTLKSITAYREFEARFGRDGDGSPLDIVATDNRQDQDQFSQELQAYGSAFDDRLNWQAGIFYFEEFGRDQNQVVLASGLFNALEAIPGQLTGAPCAAPFLAPGCPGNPINPALDLNFNIFNEIDITSVAVFSQGTFEVTDKLSVTAGLRYTYESKDYTLEHSRPASGTFIVPLTLVEDSWNEMTPMGNIQYQWTDDFMTYFTVSKGFKSGGFNGRPTVLSAAVDTFDPEKVTSFELGLKSEWLDSRLRFNAAIFRMDYSDLQVNVVSFQPSTGTLVLRTDNIGDADVEGVELEMQFVPAEGWELGWNLGYLNFEITELDPSITDITVENENVRTPEWTTSAYAQYSWPWQGYGEFSARVDWAFEDESESDITNTPQLRRRAHSIINARLSFQMPQNGWEVTLFGSNLGDTRYIENGISALNSFGTIEAVYNRPREYGVTIKKSF